jgi:hypothetical protein
VKARIQFLLPFSVVGIFGERERERERERKRERERERVTVVH